MRPSAFAVAVLIHSLSQGCGGGHGTTDAGGQNGSANVSEDAIAACTAMLTCAAVLLPTEFNDLQAAYDADGTCWSSTVGDEQCAAACDDALLGMAYVGGKAGCPDFTTLWASWKVSPKIDTNDCPRKAFDPTPYVTSFTLVPAAPPEVNVVFDGNDQTCTVSLDGVCTQSFESDPYDEHSEYGPVTGDQIAYKTRLDFRSWSKRNPALGSYSWEPLDVPCHVVLSGTGRLD